MAKYCPCCGEKIGAFSATQRIGDYEVCFGCYKEYFQIESLDKLNKLEPKIKELLQNLSDPDFKKLLQDSVTTSRNQLEKLNQKKEEKRIEREKEEEEKRTQEEKAIAEMKNKKLNEWLEITKRLIKEKSFDVEKGCVITERYYFDLTNRKIQQKFDEVEEIINLYVACGWKILSFNVVPVTSGNIGTYRSGSLLTGQDIGKTSGSINSAALRFIYVLQSPKLSELQ